MYLLIIIGINKMKVLFAIFSGVDLGMKNQPNIVTDQSVRSTPLGDDWHSFRIEE